MSDYYAPNQQVVGTEPATEEQPAVEPTKTAAKKTSKKSEDDDE